RKSCRVGRAQRDPPTVLDARGGSRCCSTHPTTSGSEEKAQGRPSLGFAATIINLTRTRNSTMRLTTLLLALLFAALGFVERATAADTTLIRSARSGAWSAADSWEGGKVPT